MAGALQIQLAGDAWYFGKNMRKPTIGGSDPSVEMRILPGQTGCCMRRVRFGMIVFNGIKITLLLLLL